MISDEMYRWAEDLFPIDRSLTGPGVRETLAYLNNLLPDLTVYEVPSGTPAFDWTVPDEWTIRDAYITDEAGNRVIDFQKHNLHVLNRQVTNYVRYSFLDRGSDERQYCSPLIDLPVVSIMRTKYGAYSEYHTSLDDLSLISPDGLEGAFRVLQRCLQALEVNYRHRAIIPCEPQLGKRGLYPTLSTIKSSEQVRTMMDLLAYADGEADLLGIADIIDADIMECAQIAEKLEKHGLLEKV